MTLVASSKNEGRTYSPWHRSVQHFQLSVVHGAASLETMPDMLLDFGNPFVRGATATDATLPTRRGWSRRQWLQKEVELQKPENNVVFDKHNIHRIEKPFLLNLWMCCALKVYGIFKAELNILI